MSDGGADCKKFEVDSESSSLCFREPFVRSALRLRGESGQRFHANDARSQQVDDGLKDHRDVLVIEEPLYPCAAIFMLLGESTLTLCRFGKLGFEFSIVPLKGEMKRAGLQQVLDPEQHLGLLEGLGDEVFCTGGERALLRIERRVGGQHQDGREGSRRDNDAQLFEHGNTVKVGHVQVEQDEVGFDRLILRDRFTRVGDPDDPSDADAFQQALEQTDVGLVVVDDEDHRIS